MGKWLNKIWIGMLASTAALTACNIFVPPPCYYGPPPIQDDSDGDTIETTIQDDRREVLRQRIKAIRDILEERSNSEIYAAPEIMEEYAKENLRLKAEADSLEQELKSLEKE